jgi:hypothetical protein
MTETARRIRVAASVFELPQRLGILQYVEYEPPPKEWCAGDGCLYEGLLSAEGCRRGVCIKYRVWVHSRDRRRWEAKEKWRRRRDEEAGGCIRQQVADALWELSGRFEVGVWYEYVRVGTWSHQFDVFCGVVVNGVKLDQPYCRAVEECVEEILRDYRREVERLREPPVPALVIKTDPVEELLREWPELGAFGTEWVRKWLDLRDRLIEIAKIMRRYPWMVEVVKQRPMSILHPYMIEVYMTKDGSEACLSLNPPKAFCARDRAVKEIKLELEFKRYEVYEEKIREVYRPKGLLAFIAATKEYVRIL